MRTDQFDEGHPGADSDLTQRTPDDWPMREPEPGAEGEVEAKGVTVIDHSGQPETQGVTVIDQEPREIEAKGITVIDQERGEVEAKGVTVIDQEPREGS